MNRLGFSNHFFHLIHQCLSFVACSILLNGFKYERITPIKGLRERDSISPYLFFAIEALSRLIDKSKSYNLIHGIKVEELDT